MNVYGPVTFAAAGAPPSGAIENAGRDKPNLMVRIASGAPSWVVVYQGSPNGVNWTTMITHDSTTNASGETIFIGAERYPCIYRRLFCVSLSGGTVEALGWASQ